MTRRAVLFPLAAVGSIAVAILVAYAGSLRAPFVAGDWAGIVHNASLRDGWAGWLRGPPGFSVVLARPVLNVSFALNYAAGGLDVTGYHAVNLIIHLGNALLLYGIIRRTCAGGSWFAWGCALLWAVHPLQTEAVTHLAQRAESLMTLFLFSALYAFIRGEESQRRAPPSRGHYGWFGAAVLACWLGMGTHEDMVSAPFIVMLYDRTFLAGSWREVLRRRGLVHGAMLLSLSWAAELAWRYHSRDHTYGFGTVPWLTYAGAAFPAFAHYLRLTVWPYPLVLEYGNRYVTDGWRLVPGGLEFTLFTALALSTFYRPTAVSFLAVALLELLEPTSVVPHVRETLAEHRMYPALAPLLVGAIWSALSAVRWLRGSAQPFLTALRSGVGLRRNERRWFAATIAILALALGAGTIWRNQVYRREPEALSRGR